MVEYEFEYEWFLNVGKSAVMSESDIHGKCFARTICRNNKYYGFKQEKLMIEDTTDQLFTKVSN